MAALTPVVATRAGVDSGMVAATTGGDTFPTTGKELVIIKNADTASHTVTFGIQAQVDGVSVAGGKAVVVPAGKTVVAGPFPPNLYSSTLKSGGNVAMTYDVATQITVGVVTFPS